MQLSYDLQDRTDDRELIQKETGLEKNLLQECYLKILIDGVIM